MSRVTCFLSSNWMARSAATVLTFAVVSTLTTAGPGGALAAREAPPLATAPFQVSDASVSVSCPFTIGGSFEARASELAGEVALEAGSPGAVAGALAMDLRTLQTGIGLRDAHMRDKYLEVGRGTSFAVSTLDHIRLTGVDPVRLAGKGGFEGMLRLHGRERPVVGVADIQRTGEGFRVQATFPVTLSEFEIEHPTYLGVGVGEVVTVTARFRLATERRR